MRENMFNRFKQKIIELYNAHELFGESITKGERAWYRKGLRDAERAAKETLEKQMPKQVRTREPSSVKAFDGETKILTYRCYPCPTCGKWIIDNENHKYCQWCGQALDWSAPPTKKGGGE